MPVAKKGPEKGDPVWAFGFPEAAVRKNAKNSDGSSKYFTYGKVFSSLSEGYFARLEIPPETMKAMESSLLSPWVFLSNADSNVGMSGGMLMNAAGEVVGVDSVKLSRGLSEKDEYFDVTEIAVRADWVRSNLSSVFGPEKASHIFDCP
jgi:hypothetical protein